MKKRIIVVLMLAVLLSGALIATGQASGIFNFSSQKSETVTISKSEYDRLSQYEKMDYILQYIEAWYWQEPDVDSLLEYAIRGMLAGLEDPYTFYYNEAEWADMLEDDEGVYGGVGLELLGNAETNIVTITRVFRDTPAERAGIRKGDVLVRVEEIEVNAYTMQDAVNIMRGELDKEVEIEVRRKDEYLTFHVPRAVIVINRVEYTMLEDNVGYIMLYRFEGESEKEFAAALSDLRSQGAKSLIVDVRDNPGGWVLSATEIADLFLDETVIIYSEDRYGERDEYRAKDGKDDIPLVFLVNGNSASASEILSGSMQDLGRATLVGTQTFGKGIMQSVIGLTRESYNTYTDGFQMTTAQYFLPSGTAVHKIGITPDVISEMPEELANEIFPLGDLSDPQLKDAWEVAKGLIKE